VIEFQCPCGKRLTAKDEHAGRTVQCPTCSARVTVPVPAPVPEDEGPALSGPEALVAAIREATAEELADADIPEAEVIEETPEVGEAVRGLDALARAIGPAAQAAGRTASRPAARFGKAARPAAGKATRPAAGKPLRPGIGKAAGRPGARTPAALQPVNGPNGKMDTHKRNVIIAVAAGAGVLILLLIILAIVGGQSAPPPPPPPPPQVYVPPPKRPTGPLPGELFPKVRPKDEEDPGQNR